MLVLDERVDDFPVVVRRATGRDEEGRRLTDGPEERRASQAVNKESRQALSNTGRASSRNQRSCIRDWG